MLLEDAQASQVLQYPIVSPRSAVMLLKFAQASRVSQFPIVSPRLEVVLLVAAQASQVLQFHLLELQEHQREHRHILAIFLEPPHILVEQL